MAIKKKRNLSTISLDSGVGLTMLAGGFHIFKQTFEIAEELAPKIQEHVGTIGSNILEYGYSSLYAICATGLTYLAVKATDKFLVDRQ
ncbi:hypothetical protein GOV12_05375 [Candidatus Pacearchaeota archaeon]|nr:hypothetical protein [Candidatus Pacearchaeota archaeon]